MKHSTTFYYVVILHSLVLHPYRELMFVLGSVNDTMSITNHRPKLFFILGKEVTSFVIWKDCQIYKMARYAQILNIFSAEDIINCGLSVPALGLRALRPD